MKTLVKILLGLVVIIGLLIALNFSKIQRLQTVNTLFDADKIVSNFSNMKEAFLYQQLDGSVEPFVFPENPKQITALAGPWRSLLCRAFTVKRLRAVKSKALMTPLRLMSHC